MKKILSAFICFLFFFSATAQDTILQSSNWQFSIFGGASMPLGSYKEDPGRAKTGINAGLSIERFFGKGNWGISLEGRYQKHNMRPFDTDSATSPYVFSFTDGFSMFTQESHPAFNHYIFSLGPVYRWQSPKIDINLYAKAGVIFQEYPEYRQTIMARNPFTSSYEKVIDPFYTDNGQGNPIAPAGIIGAKFIYNFSPRLGLGIQADYLRAFGEKGKFTVAEHAKIQEIRSIKFEEEGQQSGRYTTNINEYYNPDPERRSAVIQDLNVGLVLQWKPGGKHRAAPGEPGGMSNATITVQDKITGEKLSNVNVQLTTASGEQITGLTDKDGQFITPVKKIHYSVTGKLDDMATTSSEISQKDVERNNLHKILYYDDERFILKGQTVDCETGKPIAGVSTQLTVKGSDKSIFTESDSSGYFYFRLEHNADFHIVANQNGKFSQTEIISTRGLNRDKTVFVTLKLGVCDIEEGSEFVVKNILYDFDKADIRPDAAIVLNNIVNIMKSNPSMSIELSSHTDSRGDNNYNLQLSQRRAESAVAYLVAKGISRSRLTARGYGESKLVNNCGDNSSCTEDEHEQNRRTEIKVLKY